VVVVGVPVRIRRRFLARLRRQDPLPVSVTILAVTTLPGCPLRLRGQRLTLRDSGVRSRLRGQELHEDLGTRDGSLAVARKTRRADHFDFDLLIRLLGVIENVTS